jgi:hypothetical protein
MNAKWDNRVMLHAAIAPDIEVEPRRRAPRAPLAAEIPLRELGTTAVEAKLINISSFGFMAETEADIAAGSRVWLTLPGASRVNALVVWARGGRLGGEFSEPIDPLLVFTALGEGISAPR